MSLFFLAVPINLAWTLSPSSTNLVCQTVNFFSAALTVVLSPTPASPRITAGLKVFSIKLVTTIAVCEGASAALSAFIESFINLSAVVAALSLSILDVAKRINLFSETKLSSLFSVTSLVP